MEARGSPRAQIMTFGLSLDFILAASGETLVVILLNSGFFSGWSRARAGSLHFYFRYGKRVALVQFVYNLS